MLRPTHVSSVAIGLPIAEGLWLAPKRGHGRSKWCFQPTWARPYELMGMLLAEARVS